MASRTRMKMQAAARRSSQPELPGRMGRMVRDMPRLPTSAHVGQAMTAEEQRVLDVVLERLRVAAAKRGVATAETSDPNVSKDIVWQVHDLHDPAVQEEYSGSVSRIAKWVRGKRRGKDVWAGIVKDEETRRARKNLREIVVYLVFLLLFQAAYVFPAQRSTNYYYSASVVSQFTNLVFGDFELMYADQRTSSDFYEWLDAVAVQALYTSFTYPGPPAPGTLFAVDHLVGGVRISQLRVRQRSCIDVPFPQAAYTCGGGSGGEWHSSEESTEAFGTGPRTFEWGGWNASRAFTGLDEERDLLFAKYRSSNQMEYPAGAYAVVLPHEGEEEARALIQELREGDYIDAFTRAVFVEFTTYNANLELFCNIVFTVESLPSGGILPSLSSGTHTAALYTPWSLPDSWAWLELLVAAFYVYFIVFDVLHCKAGVRHHFSKASSWLDMINNLIFVFAWAMRLASLASAPDADSVDPTSDVFYPFHAALVARTMSSYAVGVAAFINWFKLVTYLSYAPRFGMVTGTLARAARGVSGFGVIFLCTIYGFASAHMLTFGTKLFGFRNITESLFTLLRSLLGDFDFEELQNAQYLLGPLFFGLFIGVAVFVVLNILIAIISDAYADEQSFLRRKEQKARDEGKSVSLAAEMREYVVELADKAPLLGRFVRYMRERDDSRDDRSFRSASDRDVAADGDAGGSTHASHGGDSSDVELTSSGAQRRGDDDGGGEDETKMTRNPGFDTSDGTDPELGATAGANGGSRGSGGHANPLSPAGSPTFGSAVLNVRMIRRVSMRHRGDRSPRPASTTAGDGGDGSGDGGSGAPSPVSPGGSSSRRLNMAALRVTSPRSAAVAQFRRGLNTGAGGDSASGPSRS